MSIKATIISQFQEIRAASNKASLPPTDDLVLLDSGLDSLGLAILVTRLEDTLGLDPFTDAEITVPPVTLGDFIRLFTSMPPNPVRSIRDILGRDDCSGRFLCDASKTVGLPELLRGSRLSGRRNELLDRSILLVTRSQLAAASALIELDGIVGRIIICPPDITSQQVPSLIERGRVDAIVSDYELPDQECFKGLLRISCDSEPVPAAEVPSEPRQTEWVLLTSGTTSEPKLIVHNLATLTAPIGTPAGPLTAPVWGTFYDIRRYGGLQIFLRAVLGTGSMVLSNADEAVADHLVRLGDHAVTHLSGTPSHWRRALMSPNARRIAPNYIRLSGEIADQAILNTLHSFYPQAAISHAFASTEAGVAFEVKDGIAGFPASLLGPHASVDMKVSNDSLQIRSDRVAFHVADPDGFVDTGDIVELRGDRYYFLGRRSGVINVGGLKVYPEEVEAVINRHPAVRMSVVRPRKNPIMGSLVSAEVMLKPTPSSTAEIRLEILEICRQNLPLHKIPAVVRCVPSLEVAPAGKLVRHHA